MKAACCLIILAAGTGRAAGAQVPPDSLGLHAERLQAEGQFAEGAALLTRELERCGRAPEQRACRAWVLDALGYLHQRQIQFDPEQERSLLIRAIDFYRSALLEGSRSAASLSNLAVAYRALGREDDLQALLTSAIARDRARAGPYYIMIAESQERREAWNAARDTYTGRGLPPSAGRLSDQSVPRGRRVGNAVSRRRRARV
jgi:hypothetical protein